jgi:hypothetical protein
MSVPTDKPRQWYDARSYHKGRRTFSAEVKRLAWKRCNHQCQDCTRQVTGAGDIIFDHIVPWEISRDSSLGTAKCCARLATTTRPMATTSRPSPRPIGNRIITSAFPGPAEGPDRCRADAQAADRRRCTAVSCRGRVKPRSTAP